MNEIKKNWKKWISCFAFAVAVIVVYKVLDNFGEIQNVIVLFAKSQLTYEIKFYP